MVDDQFTQGMRQAVQERVMSDPTAFSSEDLVRFWRPLSGLRIATDLPTAGDF
jgi:hypothetical protein